MKHPVRPPVKALPLTDAEMQAFGRQINSTLLERFIATIDELRSELDTKDTELRAARSSDKGRYAR